MTNTGPTREADDDGLFRGLFARREPSLAEPTMTPTEEHLAITLAEAVDERLEEGLRTLEEQATALLREVATEVWRTGAKDVRPEQERIMTLLARDQAIRSLITSSDERFQTLAVKTARLEDHLNDLTDSERRTREAMESSAEAIREIATSPTLHGVDIVRTQLEQVELHIAEAFAHMDERDKHMSETVLTQVREHGELIANETSRVVESMQAYVQGGAEAVGRLAQRIEEHAQLFITQDHNITDHVRETVGEQVAELSGQIDMVREKVGLHGRDQEELRSRMEALIEARVRGLAELIRSDSTAIRDLIASRGIDEATMQILPLPAPPVDDAGLTRIVDDRMASMETIMHERMSSLERTIAEEVLALSTAMNATIDRNLDRMVSATGSMDGLDELVTEGQTALEERMIAHVDDRMTAIAKLIRSDNQALAGKISAMGSPEEALDPELLRGVLRSVKELQAGMASDMVGTMDRRFQAIADQMHREGQAQAESMLKIAEILSDKIDRLSVRVDETVGDDIQIVVDRMSDAIRAMSSQRRDIA
jgi:hypothetical protein